MSRFSISIAKSVRSRTENAQLKLWCAALPRLTDDAWLPARHRPSCGSAFLDMTAIGDLEVVDDDQLVVELGHLAGPSLGSVRAFVPVLPKRDLRRACMAPPPHR